MPKKSKLIEMLHPADKKEKGKKIPRGGTLIDLFQAPQLPRQASSFGCKAINAGFFPITMLLFSCLPRLSGHTETQDFNHIIRRK